jgi:predicted DNA-binding protein
MTDIMTKTSFFLPKSMIRKIKNLSNARHESMASSMRYIMEKGLERNTTESLIKEASEEMIKSDNDTNKKLKYLLFKSIVRLDSIAQKLMDDKQHNRDINDHNNLIQGHEKEFCEQIGLKP